MKYNYYNKETDGNELELSRGWMRASQRALAPESTPWEPVLRHDRREALTPGETYELRIPIVPTARLVGQGERIAVRIKSSDLEPAANSLENLARNHLYRQAPAQILIHHDEAHPSRIDLPVTRGNVLGTFFSGGDIAPNNLRTRRIA